MRSPLASPHTSKHANTHGAEYGTTRTNPQRRATDEEPLSRRAPRCRSTPTRALRITAHATGAANVRVAATTQGAVATVARYWRASPVNRAPPAINPPQGFAASATQRAVGEPTARPDAQRRRHIRLLDRARLIRENSASQPWGCTRSPVPWRCARRGDRPEFLMRTATTVVDDQDLLCGRRCATGAICHSRRRRSPGQPKSQTQRKSGHAAK